MVVFFALNIMALFHLPQELESLTGGAARFDCTEIYPISGNINQPAGTYIGSGQASGNVTFQFGSGSSVWWSPAMSYFRMQLAAVKRTASAESAPVLSDKVALCDNFVATLFQKISLQINSKVLDTIDNVPVMDTALHYANCKKGFLDSFGSLTWLNVPFETRLINTCNNVKAATGETFSVIEVIFRPCLSLFDVKLLPPGAQYTLIFNMAASAANAWESLYGDVTTGLLQNQFNLRITSFSLFQSVITPSMQVQYPESGIIDLSPAILNQYYLNQGNTLKQNITLPSTTNRVLVCMQDTSTSNFRPTFVGAATDGTSDIQTGIGRGFNPVTNFGLLAYGGTSASGATVAENNFYNRMLSTLWLNLPELGASMPNPVYNFSDNVSDTFRAYSDFCHVTQGTIGGWEGSIPYGTLAQAQGLHTAFTSSDESVSVFNTGTYNPQLPALIFKGGATTATTTFASNSGTATRSYAVTIAAPSLPATQPTAWQAAKYGWVGNKTIFAFPVIRPEGKPVSVGTLNATFKSYSDLGANASGSNVNSVVFNVISSYSMVLQLTHQGSGIYHYEVAEGI